MNTEATLILPRTLVNRIMAHAQTSPDTEACGLVSAVNGLARGWYPVSNIAADPAHRFEMDPEQQIAAMKQMRDRDEELFAIVHSHPDSPATPSITDMEEIGYPGAYYMIVSLGTRGVLELRCFRQQGEGMTDVELLYEHGD